MAQLLEKNYDPKTFEDRIYNTWCEKGYFKPLIWIMERAGFKTYHKWTRMEYVKYVSQKGFRVIRDILVEGKPLSECVLVAEKSNPV